ncbi:MAG: hypothetical protein ACR2N4_02220 [Jatrophihabitans sp.]
MTTLTATPTAAGGLPPLRETAGLAIGTVYVFDNGVPVLADGQQAVLATAEGGTLEVLTKASIGQAVTAPGTYLHAGAYAHLFGQSTPTLRLYLRKDTYAKLSSAAGFLTALTAALALVTAIVGIFFVLSTMTAPAATTINDRAQSLLEWVANPATAGDPAARAARAETCLQQIRGDASTTVSVPGIACTAVHTPLWRQSTVGSVMTGAIGVLAALLGSLTLRSKFGFQKSPAT